jgi:DNA-binding response OmpR family regulator
MSRERKATILLVEDNKPIEKLVRFILADAGYTVLTAETGRRGLRSIREHAPDLVLLDLDLPDVDGFEVLGEARNGRRLEQTAVVAFTAHATQPDKLRAESAGFDGFIAKPIDPVGFVAQIESFLLDRRSA